MKTRYTALFLSLFLAACSNSEPQKPDAQNPNQNNNQTVSIGFSISSIATNPFFQNMYRSVEQLDRDNNQLTITLNSADNDQEKQNHQLEAMVANGARALIVNLAKVADGQTVLQHWCSKNIPVVYFNRSPGEKNLAACESAYFVDADMAQAGVYQGQQVLQQWHSNPTWDKNRDGIIQYAMLKGLPEHEGTALRSQWVISTINTYPQTNVPTEKVFEDFGMFQAAKAEEITAQWMTQPNFDKVEVILANNDTMALGILNALKTQGRKIPVFGIDGSKAALEAVQAGEMAGTVFNDFQAQADAAVNIAANLAAGKHPTEGLTLLLQRKTVVIPVRQIERSQLNEFLGLYQ